VPFEDRVRKEKRIASKRTLTIGQRRKGFTDGDAHGDVEHIANDWMTLWAWRIPWGWFHPSPDEDEGKSAKQQCVEHGPVEHGDKGQLNE
jgi:hypothetical protein